MAGASRVRVKRESSGVIVLDTNPSTVVGVSGVTERGPIGETRTLTSFQEFKDVYGDLVAHSDTPLEVKSLFEEAGENGGVLVEMNRVVHFATPGDPTTKTSSAATLDLMTAAAAPSAATVLGALAEPFVIEPGSTLKITTDASGPTTVTFTATAAALESDAGPFTLSDNDTLIIKVDSGAAQTLTFATSEFASIAAATAGELAAAVNAKVVGAKATVTSTNKVTITSDRKGQSSDIEVTGGTALSDIFSVTVAAGTGDLVNTDRVFVTTIKGIVESAVSGVTVSADNGRVRITRDTTGASSSVQVDASSTAATSLGLDSAVHTGLAGSAVATLRVRGKTDGAYANQYQMKVSASSSGDSSERDFSVLKDGVQLEGWANLSLDPASPRYWPNVVNDGAASQKASQRIHVEVLTTSLTAPANLPASGTFGPLSAGSDGLAGLADADWTGGVSSNGRTGLRCLDLVWPLDIILCPGRATSAVHNGMVNYCEVVRDGLCFAILDTPASLTGDQMITYVTSTAMLKELSEMAAIHWPRIKVDNPNTEVYGSGDTVVVGPSGALAGLCARLDQSKPGGAFEHPASMEIGSLRTARGLETDEVKDIAIRGRVFDALINPIMVKRGNPIWVDGARTLKSTGPFPTIGESRGVLQVSVTIADALDPKRNRNMRPRFYNEIDMSVSDYLSRLTAAECFASNVDAEAWSFNVGPALNTPAVQATRTAEARLGLATTAPGEFINVTIFPLRRAATA